MRILIFELDLNGHRGIYVRQLCDALLSLRSRVSVESQTIEITITTCEPDENKPDADQTNHVRALQAVCYETDGVELDLVPALVQRSSWQTARGKLAAFDRAVKQSGADHVYLPTGDGLVQLLGLRQCLPIGSGLAKDGLEIEAVIHRFTAAYIHAPKRAKQKTRLAAWSMSKAPLSRLHFVDPLAWQWMQAHYAAKSDRWTLLPDPIDNVAAIDQAEARTAMDLPREAKIIGCVGVMNQRKGVDRLVQGFLAGRESGVLNDQTQLLLAGRQDDAVKAALAVPAARSLIETGAIRLIDRYLPLDELHQLLASMDVVALLYTGHCGIASIALRSAQLGRPVLANDEGWLGEMVPQLGLGQTVKLSDTTNSADLLPQAIADALDHATHWSPTHRLEKFMAFNAATNFQTTLTDRLRESLGLEPSPERVSWDQVWH